MGIITALLSNPVVIGVLVACVFTLISFIVYKTKSTKDDEVWHALQGMIFNAFNMAEKAIPDSSEGKLGKADQALKTFVAEYSKREGKAPDEAIVQFAKDEWSILATEIKKK